MVDTFKDAKGRVWRPSMSLKVIRDFEIQAGSGVFDHIFDALEKYDWLHNLDETKITSDQLNEIYKTMFTIGRMLFGNIGNVGFLLFTACGGSKNDPLKYIPERKTADETAEIMTVSYDDFCSAITEDEITDALRLAVEMVFGFFPKQEKGSNRGGSEGGEKKELSLGKTFMKSPDTLV